MTTPLFIGLASGLGGLALLGAAGLGGYCLYKSCATKPGTWNLEDMEVEKGELEEDQAASLLFFHNDQDSSSVILSTQVTPTVPAHMFDDAREENSGKEEYQQFLKQWKLADYVGSQDSPFASDDEGISDSPASQFGIQDTNRTANG